MNSEVLVSIIIPTFNPNESLFECLQSIPDSSEIEILVQDNSTIQFPQVRPRHNLFVHSESDSGIYDAMNRGAAKANGEYLYFMGSDDILLSGFTKVLEYLKSNKPDFLYGDVVITPGNTRYDGKFDSEKLAEKNICHQAILVKYSLFNSLGGFNMTYPILADYEFNLKVFGLSSVVIEYVNEVIAEFSLGGVSSMGRFRDPNFICAKPALLVSQLGISKSSLLYIESYKAKVNYELEKGNFANGLKSGLHLLFRGKKVLSSTKLIVGSLIARMKNA